ncbi:hypothetical protein [Hymenobacter cellulosivorans]|uniref:DUF3592 domain-containing protein n=1 Tax=Hymenobacter cellulosivorans TaxID=2932249 RepID=A0ABY4FAC2_9BACT|nr:hypothetical protein [Hymenobacter cellulosivorans]UOQ52874.1 hypothetical protein MUN80_24420 [Hymenobacter cellulosivorans]
MSEETIVLTIFSLIGSALFFLHYRYSRALVADILKHGYHTEAVVTAYREDVVRVAGSWTSLEYPYLTYISEAGEVKCGRLKYASSRGRLLWIDQEVEIVVYQQKLFYLPELKQSFWARLLT